MVRESLGRLVGGGCESVWWDEGGRATIDKPGIAPTAGPVVGSMPDSGLDTGLLVENILMGESGCI